LQSLSWVNLASRRQQGTSVSFVALTGIHAFGQKRVFRSGSYAEVRRFRFACFGLAAGIELGERVQDFASALWFEVTERAIVCVVLRLA